MNYNYGALIDNGSKMSYGHLSFLDKDYLLHSSAKNSVKVEDEEVEKVETIANVTKALKRIMVSASAMSAKKNIPVGIMAIDVTKETMRKMLF